VGGNPEHPGAAVNADQSVQCLLPGPWHVADGYLYPEAVPVEDDCFDIETDMDIYEAAFSPDRIETSGHEGDQL
jgi:hypothetical protein